MGKSAAYKIHERVQSQFDHMQKIRELILQLSESDDDEDKKRAEELAEILASLSREAKKINDIAYESAA